MNNMQILRLAEKNSYSKYKDEFSYFKEGYTKHFNNFRDANISACNASKANYWEVIPVLNYTCNLKTKTNLKLKLIFTLLL